MSAPSRRGPRAGATAAGGEAFFTLALATIRNPGLRSYVGEQLLSARNQEDRAAALKILMDSIGWSDTHPVRPVHGLH